MAAAKATLDAFIRVYDGMLNAVALEDAETVIRHHAFDAADLIDVTGPSPVQATLKRLEFGTHRALWDVAQRYALEFPSFAPVAHEGIRLLRNKTVAKQPDGANRSLAVVLGLNDDYEGGQIAFFDGTTRLRVGRGQALVFPSTYLYPHQDEAVTRGTRYSLVSWF